MPSSTSITQDSSGRGVATLVRPPQALPELAGQAMLLLHLHRTATTGQLAELLTPEAADTSYLRRILRATAAAGLIDFVHDDSAQQKVWFLSRAGYAIAEASGDVAVCSHRMTPALAKGALLARRLATVDVGAAFVRAARQHPSDGCTPWLSRVRTKWLWHEFGENWD